MFADDLALTEELELEAMGVFEEGMESGNGIKGLIFTMEKAKLIVTGEELRHRVQSGGWRCGKVVGVN